MTEDQDGIGQEEVGSFQSWLCLGIGSSTHRISEGEPWRDIRAMDGLLENIQILPREGVTNTKNLVCKTQTLLNTHSKSWQVPHALSMNLVWGFLPMRCKIRSNCDSR